MSDTYTEVTSNTWMDRMMKSIVGVLGGLVLFVLGFPLLAWNEYNSLQTFLSIDEGQQNCVHDVKPEPVNSGNEGKLIHTIGEATTTDQARDETLGVSLVAIQLHRKVEMYQWEEEKKTEKRGDKEITTYTYSKTWKDSLQESSGFKEGEGHDNPSTMVYRSEAFFSPKVTIGGLTFSEALVKVIPGKKPLPWDETLLAGLKDEVKNSSKVSGEYLFFRPGAAPAEPGPEGAKPASANIDTDNPLVGDYRIQFQAVKSPQPVTVLAMQKDAKLDVWTATNGYPISKIAAGSHTAEQMFDMLRSDASTWTWIFRIVGLGMLVGGLNLIFAPIATVLDWVPLVGDLLKGGVFLFALALGVSLGFVTIAIAWIAVRPLLGIGLLVAAIALIFGLRYLASMFSSPPPAPAPKMA